MGLPPCECFHIPAFAISIGTIVLVDLRLLGVAFRRETAARLLKDTEAWTLVALIVVILSGFILYLSQTEIYLANSSFYFKIACLLTAIIYNYTIHRKVASSPDVSPGIAKLVGAVSLALWVAVVFGGIFIAFV
jgi:hypothetical protein